jgi:ABC-2 type transport system ATP-binding protein
VDAALRIDNVTKRYGKLVAVDRVSLAVPPGVALGLVGPNGSGKTTLIRCCVGILKPEEGQVWVDGRDLTSGDVEAKRGLAYAPELPDPMRMLTPWDHLAFVANVLEIDGWEKEAERLLLAFDMGDKRDQLAMSLSKGEMQKVMLAMAFLRKPKVLFLDEPLLGLDPRAAFSLKNEVRGLLASGGSAVIASHVLSLIEELCAAMAILTRGRLGFIGTPEGLRAAALQAPGTPLEEAFVRVTEPGGGIEQ